MSSSKGFLSLYEFQLIDDAGNPTTTTNTTPQDTSTTNNAQTGQTSSTDTSTNTTPTQTGQSSSTDTSTNTTPAQNNPTTNNAQTAQTSSTDTSTNTTPTQTTPTASNARTGQTSTTDTSNNTTPTQAGPTSSTGTSTNTTPAQNNPTTNNAQTGQTSSTDTSTNTTPTQTGQSSSTDTSAADTPAPTLDDLLGQAETQSPPPQQYNQYLPQNYDQYAPFIPQSAGDDGIPWLTLIGEFLGLIIFAGSVFLCFLGYVLYKRRYQNMIEEYASDPESQIKKQELTKEEEQHLAEWNFNPPENFIPGVQVTNEKGRLGQYFKIVFTETQDEMIRTITSNHQIHQVENKENCYFEFEIEDIDVGVDIVIGLGTKDSFHPAVLPGDQKNTIGFHSKGGILKINGTEVNAYTLDAQFGETIGLGYNFDTSKIYLFYNAKYLNEPQREFGSPSKQSEQKSKSPSPKKGGEKENKIDLQIDKKEYFPMIGATGKCTILLNIGGSPFSIHHKEIAKGLL